MFSGGKEIERPQIFWKQIILHIYNILAINNYYMYISIQLLSIL